MQSTKTKDLLTCSKSIIKSIIWNHELHDTHTGVGQNKLSKSSNRNIGSVAILKK